MKKPIILLTAIALTAGASARAQSTIADWTFESFASTYTSTGSAIGPFNPEGGAGSFSANHAGATTVYSSPAGNGTPRSISSTLWAVGDYYQIEVSTAGYSSISLSFAQASSGTGPASFGLFYSTDGTHYTQASTYSVLDNGLAPNAAWNSTTASSAYDFGVPTALSLSTLTSDASDNDATFYLRFEDVNNTTDAAGTAAVGTGGTDRMDNILIQGVAVPEPSAMALFGIGGTVCLGFLRRLKK